VDQYPGLAAARAGQNQQWIGNRTHCFTLRFVQGFDDV
jgi:hypothetical protein